MADFSSCSTVVVCLKCRQFPSLAMSWCMSNISKSDNLQFADSLFLPVHRTVDNSDDFCEIFYTSGLPEDRKMIRSSHSKSNVLLSVILFHHQTQSLEQILSTKPSGGGGFALYIWVTTFHNGPNSFHHTRKNPKQSVN